MEVTWKEEKENDFRNGTYISDKSSTAKENIVKYTEIPTDGKYYKPNWKLGKFYRNKRKGHTDKMLADLD